jgi:TM2 domain-containing membrane protein YozV
MARTVDKEGKTVWVLEEPKETGINPDRSSAASAEPHGGAHPALAFSLSLLVWGGGQFYNRQWQLGLFYLLAMVNFYLAPAILLIYWQPITSGLQTLDVTPSQVIVPLGIFFITGLMMWVINAVHAYVTAADAHPEGFQGVSHPALPALCSLLIPGWGQILNGQMKKGVCYLLVAVAGWFALAVLLAVPFLWPMLANPADRLLVQQALFIALLLAPLVVVAWVISIYDAIKVCIDPLKKEPWRKRVEYALTRMRLGGWRGMVPRMELTLMVSLYLVFSLALSHYYFPRDYYAAQFHTLQTRLAQQQMHLISQRLDSLVQKVSATEWLPRRDTILM